MRWFRHTRSGVESTKLLPACAQPEAREDCPFVQGVFRVDSAGLCDGEGGLPARRAFLRVCPIDLPAYKAAEKAYEEVYGKQPIPVRSGGSIPIIATFEEVLGIKSILMGFGLGADAIHSPNENYPLEQFFNGITTIPLFYKYFGEEMKK